MSGFAQNRNRSRHIAQEGQTASALAAQAAKKAIADAGIAAEQIEAIIRCDFNA